MDASRVSELEARRARAHEMGGAERTAKLRLAGRLPARERLTELLDPGSFEEIGGLAHSQLPDLADRTPADGTIVGSGRIDGRGVFVSADDPTVLVGTRGRVAEVKLGRVRELAIREGKPFIMLSEAGAARIQEARGALSAGLGAGFEHHFRMSGRVPQISVLLGACFGGPSFVASQGDFTVMVAGTGFLGMSGPPVVKVGIGMDVSAEEIGGVEMAARVTGQVDYIARSESEALSAVRRYLSYFPANSQQRPPGGEARGAPCESDAGRLALTTLVPENNRPAYDAVKLVSQIVDTDSLFELRPEYGRNLITGLARMAGAPVGILANNPMHKAGVLDEKAAIKARKFIDLCDAFHIPLVFFCDTPGFLVGPEIEKHRMVSLCGRLMNSLIAASVPKVTVVIRKAVGMAYLAMCGRMCHPNAIVAWPTAFFDVMGPEAGVMLVHGKEIAAAADPTARKREILHALEEQASAYTAAGMGLIDDVIAPHETRGLILATLERARGCDTPGFKHRIDP